MAMSEAKTDVEGIGGQEPVALKVPSRAQYALLLRLVASNVGQVAGFSPEEIYDLKLAVTEAVTNVVRHAEVESFVVEYRALPGAVEVRVEDEGGGFDSEGLSGEPGLEGGFGLAVIRSLVDELSLESTGGGTRLRMLLRTSRPARAANG